MATERNSETFKNRRKIYLLPVKEAETTAVKDAINNKYKKVTVIIIIKLQRTH
jgi:hypothetical protein